MNPREFTPVCLICLASVLLPRQVTGQPTISSINLRGLQAGETNVLVITGSDLVYGSTVALPFPVEQQTVEAKGSTLKVRVSVGKQVAPGMYPIRVHNRNGLSRPLLIGVDRLRQVTLSPELGSLPVAVTGSCIGAQIKKSVIRARKDELVILEVEAQRMGSKLRPVVHLYDARGRQVGFAQPTRSLGGDCRCVIRIPDDGEYQIELHDFLYRGASPGFFRLKVGQFGFADLCLPVGVSPENKTILRMIKFGAESEFLEEFLPGEPGWTFAQPKVADFSGRRPLVFVSNTREFTEPANENAPFPAGKVPVALNGRIEVPNEVDAYVIEVEPGSRITFDLLAWRIGSPLDGKIVLKNEQGQVLAQNDDREGAEDPLLNYNVPGNLKKLIVEVSDVAAGGSKSDIYRLDIYRQDRPDIVATVPVDTLNIPKNGTGFLPVRVQRNNHSGPIDLVFHGLPNTYQVSGNRIEADSNVGLVTITAKDPSPAFFSIEARCQAGDLIRSQDVFAPETEFARGQSVWRKRIAVATEESRSLAVQWNLVDNTPVFLGSKFNTEVTLRTSEPSPGPVRIRVVTNQEVHRKLVRKNNKSTFVPDLESAIRAADVELKPEQMKGSLQITIPVNIAEKTWQALVVAELLSADRKRVLATTATQPITLTTRSPGSVTIREGKILTLPTKGKINHRIQGDIKRTQPGTRCRISLAGLPKGVVVKPVVVADDTDKFDVSFEIPVNAELLKLKKLGVRFEFLGDDAKDQVLGQAKPASLKIKKAPEEKKPPKS